MTMNRSHDDTTTLPSQHHALAPGEGIGRNRLLGALPAAELEKLMPSLESVPLADGMPIYEPNQRITRVYFPISGIISLVSEMAEGTVEVGTIGREGMSGLPLVLHATTMPSRAFVQVPGHAYCMSDEDLLTAMRDSPHFERLLFRYALAGEAVASGAIHGDNVAPSLFGGLVLVRSAEPMDVVPLPVPPSLRCAMVLPRLRLDTRDARAVLPATVPMRDFIRQTANLAGVVAGCCAGDLALVARSLRDVVVEPHRAPLVPGFAEVQRGAMDAGALGCSLSGSGPSLFAWCDGDEAAARVRDAMVAAFRAAGVDAEGWTCLVDGGGARVEAVE